MKNILNITAGVAMVATLLLTASCGKDNELTPEVKENDVEQGNENLTLGNEANPLWEIPQGIYNTYETLMSVQVTLQDILLPYVTENDLMCATINGEIRAVTNTQYTGGEVYFPLIIAGENGSEKISLHYYCSKLKRTYTIEDWMIFTPGIAPTDDNGKPYIVEFIPESK